MTDEAFSQRLERLRDSPEQKRMIVTTWKLCYNSLILVFASAVCVSIAVYLGFADKFGLEFWVAVVVALLCFAYAHATQEKALMSAKWQDRDYLFKSFAMANTEAELEQAGFPYLENVELTFCSASEEEPYKSSDPLSEDLNSMSELSGEESDRQAAVVSQVQAISKILILRSEGFDATDSYEVEQVDRLLSKAKALLPSLTDPFYSGAARHAIIDALIAFDRLNAAKTMFAEIDDQLIRDKLLESYGELSDA